MEGSLGIIESLKFQGSQHKGKYDIKYEELFARRGAAYRKDRIAKYSYYYHSPGSPIAGGDASSELQIPAIDALITASKENKLTCRETAHVLAIARHESGFNPYAAAGTTSATGLGQFVEATGIAYGINKETRWDLEAQARALVEHFFKNKEIAEKRKLPEEYIYKFHHDGTKGESGD